MACALRPLLCFVTSDPGPGRVSLSLLSIHTLSLHAQLPIDLRIFLQQRGLRPAASIFLLSIALSRTRAHSPLPRTPCSISISIYFPIPISIGAALRQAPTHSKPKAGINLPLILGNRPFSLTPVPSAGAAVELCHRQAPSPTCPSHPLPWLFPPYQYQVSLHHSSLHQLTLAPLTLFHFFNPT